MAGLIALIAEITGPARRVAVCIGRWMPTTSARWIASRRRRSLLMSTHVTSHPEARSQAAGDARPNGCRPSSYVEMSSACIEPQHSVTGSPRRCKLPETDGRRRAQPPHCASTRTVRSLLHRALGALQLLLDDGDPLPLHERGAVLQCGEDRTGVRRV